MSIIEKAESFLLSNARLLERQQFNYLFRDGSRDAALAILKAYQNTDGGFGNALEPDKRTASSQPIDQEVALRILDDLGLNGSIVKNICHYLMTITTEEGGIPFVLPTVADAPRAPWWNTDSAQPPASINPTASIAGLLHKHKVKHVWLTKATSFCWDHIENMTESEAHSLICILLFLEYSPERDRAEKAFDRIQDIILQHSTLDPNAEGYVHSPLAYAVSPQSMAYRLYDPSVIEAHLEHLLKSQQDDGGWAISWPAVSPACELEYRGVVTLNNLTILKAYGFL